MKFGLAFATGGPAVQPDGLRVIAETAERVGFESLWSTEHVILPVSYDSVYPYNPTGRVPVPADTDMPDPFVPLAFVAAVTSRMRLGTAAVILPEHHPLRLAKVIGNLDVLSGGRVDLGVGVGWLREEYDALGIEFHGRGARMDAAIAALRAIWSDGPSSFDSEFFSWTGVESRPRPLRPGGAPIHITGHAPVAARRAARMGDGFIPGVSTPEAFDAIVGVVRRECERIGRDASEIDFTAGCNGGAYDVDDVRRLEDAGAQRVHAAFWGGSADAIVRQIEEYAETVMNVVGADPPAAHFEEVSG